MSPLSEHSGTILIITANYGEGHYVVSNAVKQQLESKLANWQIDIYNYGDLFNPVLERIVHHFYFIMIKRFSFFYKWYYNATREIKNTDKKKGILNKYFKNKLYKKIAEYNPDLIITTFPIPTGLVSELKSEEKVNCPLVTIITDVTSHSQWIHPSVDKYIVASAGTAKKFMNYGINSQNIYACGIPIRQQFEHSYNTTKIREKLGLKRDVFTLLVMGGGNGITHNLTDILLKLFNSVSKPVQVVIIAGTNEKIARKLTAFKDKYKFPITILGYIDNVSEVMDSADLLLSKAGGVSVYEALAKRLPLLIYKPIPGHEMCNVDFLLENKAALIANKKHEVIDCIKKAIQNPDMINEISNSMSNLSKPFATRNTVNIVLDLLDDCYKQKKKNVDNNKPA